MGTITEQFDYLHEVAPDVKLLFVGPSDMGKSRGGKITSWPLLNELNDSLKVNCLRHGVAYWDTFDVMGGTGSVSTWVNHSPAFVGPDFIHFTTKGANESSITISTGYAVRFRTKLSVSISKAADEKTPDIFLALSSASCPSRTGDAQGYP